MMQMPRVWRLFEVRRSQLRLRLRQQQYSDSSRRYFGSWVAVLWAKPDTAAVWLNKPAIPGHPRGESARLFPHRGLATGSVSVWG